MSERSKACLEALSKDLEDVLENAENIKGVNYRMYVTYIANVSTVAKIMGWLKASSTNPDSEAMLSVVNTALTMNATAYGESLGLSKADRDEALITAKTLGKIVNTTNEAYDNGNKA